MNNGRKTKVALYSDQSAIVAAILHQTAVQLTIHYNERVPIEYMHPINVLDRYDKFRDIVVLQHQDVLQEMGK
jgi:hypothetical protein